MFHEVRYASTKKNKQQTKEGERMCEMNRGEEQFLTTCCEEDEQEEEERELNHNCWF